MKGNIFDIQRFSVHDGPGIRTTVFMKGCPLRCRWCHNPEGLSFDPQLQFFEEKCIGCKQCGDRDDISDASKCPSKALLVCGREISKEELLEEIIKDKIFYDIDGGVTFSGGECLLQADFVASMLSLAKSAGINTAIDTCGYVPWSSIDKTIEHCDVYLYDIKCIDPETHKKFTGCYNTLILDNFLRLSKTGKDIWVRVPVIPNFNNTVDEMCRIADMISSFSSVKQVTLMPYHSLGAGKYKTLGLEYKFDSSLKIDERELAEYKTIFKDKKIKVI